MGIPISSLPAASSLTGNEAFPIVQSGSTKQTTLNDIPYTPAGTGAVTTTVQAKLRETVSVKDFGAVGDGVANDTIAVQAAVTHCFTNGDQLCWPDGTYLTTASIANFHSISHLGAGVVSRANNLFQITPKNLEQNSIYVATTGADSNDGLSASQPFQTIQAAFNAVGNNWISAMREGRWRIVLAAGTYARATFPTAPTTANRLRVIGPDVSLGVPTAIINGNAESSVSGLRFGAITGVEVRDIKLINFPGTLGCGILADGAVDLYTYNVHVDGAGWCGINLNAGGQIRTQYGIVENCRYGVRTYSNPTVTIGYNSTITPMIIRNCTETGVYCQNGSMGHVDYCAISNCPVGIELVNSSRVHVVETTISGCAIGIRPISNSTYIKTNVTFTGNTLNEVCYGNSINYENAFYERFEPAILRWAYGYGLSGASVNATYKYVFETQASDAGIQILSPNATIPAIAFGRVSNNVAGRIAYDHSTDTFRLITDNANRLFLSAASMLPLPDNTIALGGSGNRWTQVFAATGTINTSDAREKQQIRELSEQERAVAVRLKSLIRVFKFNDAVEKKGDGARIHFGVIAQDVKAAFEAEGLVAENYAILCYDEWPETPEERDDDGNITQEYRPAGNRYGVRYEELLAFIIAAL